MDERIRELERRARAGDPAAQTALVRRVQQSGAPLWIECEGDDYRITSWTTQYLPNGTARVEVAGPDTDALLLAPDEDAAGDAVVELIRHNIAQDPEYPRRMLGSKVEAWDRGEAVFTGDPGFSGGHWVQTLEDWIELHRDYLPQNLGDGRQWDVDDYHPALPALIGFEPGIAFPQGWV